MRHPVAVAAVVVLVVNDHVLKAIVPGLLTGKLSDVAGLMFFPLLLAELLSLVVWATAGRRSTPSLIPLAAVITAISFTLVKTTELGGTAFAWGLGAAQWLLSAGPLVGHALLPVAVVVDPTDLVALPALVVAVWIGGAEARSTRDGIAVRYEARRQGPPSRLTAAVLIMAAALSSLATTQSPVPNLTSETRETISLDSARPVVTRHLSWDVGDLDDEFAFVELNLGVWSSGLDGANQTLSPDVQISIIPDRPADLEVDDDLAQHPSRSWDLSTACGSGCQSGTTVIARLADGVEAAHDLDLVSRLIVSSSGPPTMKLTLREDKDRRTNTAPTTSMARYDETVTVTDAVPERTSRAILRIGANALDRSLAFPLVGQLTVRLDVLDGAFAPEANEAWIAIDGEEPIVFAADRPPPAIDWLDRCEPNRDCVIDVELLSRYDPTLDGEVESPDPEAAGFVKLRWNVTARLEAFDGRALPDGAVSLEKVAE